MKNDALEKAISQFGKPSRLARAAGVSPQRINAARTRGRVSTELAPLLEKATGGAVTKESLVWGNEKAAA